MSGLNELNSGMGEKANRDVGDKSDVPSPNSPARSPMGERYVKKLDPTISDRQVGNKSQTNVMDSKGNPSLPGAVINNHLMPVTTYAYDDEGAFRYRELDLVGVGWKGQHRFRVVEVVRNDNLAEFWEDMGESSNFRGGPLHLIGGDGNYIVETFGTLKEIAEQVRDQLWPHEKLAPEEFESYRLGKNRRIL